MAERRDRELGLDRRITRRDFLNGMAVGAGGALLGGRGKPLWALGLEKSPVRTAGPYPPALTGLRGSHAGAYEVAHRLRDDDFWAKAGPPQDTGERYDLVVVGAGLSGLAAARFYREAVGPTTRVLILDNHDDFGGHARRNEFEVGGHTLLGFGGTFAIDSPAPYSAAARGLIASLGVDVSRWERVYDKKLYSSRGLKRGFFFDREAFGADCLLPSPMTAGDGEGGEDKAKGDPWVEFLARAPLSEAARRDLPRLYRDREDHLPGLRDPDKKARLARITYADYLTKTAGYSPDVLPVLQARTHTLYGLGIDAVSAQDAWGLGLPGFGGMKLDSSPGPGMGRDAIRPPEGGASYFFHFPDGNASLARLLVRGLVPRAVPGRTAEDIVGARVDYGRLDESDAAVRLRLESTVVRVRHQGDPASAREVEVAYVRDGRLQTVLASRCVLACWSTVIPYLCPDLPEKQREALAYEVKVPIVYTNAVVRNWQPWVKAGVHQVHAPGGYHSSTSLDLPVAVGGYEPSRTPDDPIVVHMVRTPCQPGQPARIQHRMGRVELLETTFPTFERNVREQLARMFGPFGFDPAQDLVALTVNRWPHGYAYQYNSLWDPFWVDGGEQPCVVGRAPFGRITIANADAGAYAYTDGAIDQAHRAVQELLEKKG